MLYSHEAELSSDAKTFISKAESLSTTPIPPDNSLPAIDSFLSNSLAKPDFNKTNFKAAAKLGTIALAGTGLTGCLPTSRADAARFLQQAGFSSTSEEIDQLYGLNDEGEEVAKDLFDNWLINQINQPLGQSTWDWMIEQEFNTPEYQFEVGPITYALWKQLFTAPDVVRKRVALAWSEIFVISVRSIDCRHRSFACAGFWDTLNEYAFGNFRDLLEAVTLNPAMGLYLGTFDNRKANGQGSAPDENYAREILQLFTIGLHELNLDGTLKLDSNQQPIPTYTQQTIEDNAQYFTGWYFIRSDQRTEEFFRPGYRHPSGYGNPNELRDPMRLVPQFSSFASGGQIKLQEKLDEIFNHPNVGPFICRQLIQRLVKQNPTPAYVERVATIFNNNGIDVRGDMRAVVRAILTDNEARFINPSTDQYSGKLREPMLRLIQWARTFGARSTTGQYRIFELSDAESALGQSPLFAPSVFNFFRPGYIPPKTLFAEQGITAPEFQIVNETSVAGYSSAIFLLLNNGSAFEGDYIDADYSEYETMLDSNNPDSIRPMLDQLSLVVTAGSVSADSLDKIEAMVKTIWTGQSNWASNVTKAAIYCLMTSPEYLVQK